MTIHIKNRIQVSKFRLVINTMLHIMLSDGMRGTCGTIKGNSVEFCSWASITNRPEKQYVLKLYATIRKRVYESKVQVYYLLTDSPNKFSLSSPFNLYL